MIIEFNTIPLSTNQLFCSARGRVFKSKKYIEYKNILLEQIDKQFPNRVLLDGRLSVEIKLFYKSKRKRDIDNILKGLFDIFNGNVWVDDQQIDYLSISRKYTDTNYFIVCITENHHNVPAT